MPKRQRIILAFDVDNFYVASERLRNPGLVGKPVAIQQKTITATCSYEARERGVRKLCLIGDAKRLCPDLIIINGEDLTFYRRDSRRIWRLVTGLVGLPPEKLGMDELFLDVTALVDAHLANPVDRTARFFRLPGSEKVDRGFSYSDDVCGLYMPKQPDTSALGYERYAVASYLAAYIRSQIAEQIGFTTSGGIAPNKLLAKLLASENKPSKQTSWLPPSDPVEGSVAIEAYMADIPVKNLNGFGHRIVNTLRHHLLGEKIEEDTYWTQSVGEDRPWEPENVKVEENPLTCLQVRTATTLTKFETWYGERLGSRLWGMLWGVDDELVIPAPEYPKTISVEDSYLRAKLPTVALALQKISTLALSLLTRLQAELIDEPASLVKARPTGPPTWARHPTQMRLTLRGGSGVGSRTVPMPLDVLDLQGPPLEDRAGKLATAFHAVFRKMIGGSAPARDRDPCSFHVINLAVVAFETDAPTPSVKNLLVKPSTNKKQPLAHVWTNDSDEGSDGEEQEQCSICDEWLPAFALPAHLAYHIEEG